MGKCGCGPFKMYTKRKYLHCYVLSQKFFYCVTAMPRKWEETLCPVPKENHANAS